MTKLTILAILSLLSFCSSAKLPATFKKCNKKARNFNDCLSKAVDDGLRQLTVPIKEVGLPSLEPLDVPALTIGAGSGAVGLEQKFKDVKLYGFTKPENVKFEWDLDKNTARLETIFPQFVMKAHYDVNGKILLLPVYGEGPATITLEKLKSVCTLKFEEYEKKGKKYFKIMDSKLTLEPGLVKYNFENLFNGDKALSDNINKVLNENWQEVYLDIKDNYEDAFGKIIASVFNNFLSRVPISELFEE